MDAGAQPARPKVMRNLQSLVASTSNLPCSGVGESEASAALRRADTEGASVNLRAQAEAEATRLRAGADVQKAQAEAAATRDRAGADVAATRDRAGADVAATRDRAGADVLRAGADVLKTQAEAAAISLRAGVYAEKVQAELAALRLRAAWQRLGALALVAALGADWVLHENDTFIKWRLAAQLRSCRVPDAAAALLMPSEELPVKRSPFVPGFRPVLVLAPTGAGKSTLLVAAARATTSADAHHVPAPSALVRIRQTPSKDCLLYTSDAADE